MLRTDGRTSQAGRAGWLGLFFPPFLFLVAKLTLTKTNVSKNGTLFGEFFGKCSDSLLKISAKILKILVKKWLIVQDFGKIKKKYLLKQKIWVGHSHKAFWFFFFFVA